jgi:phage tail sheath gpL-like
MAIDFTYYPTSNRVPGVYVEIDATQANHASQLEQTLLIGQCAATSVYANQPMLVSSVAQVTNAYGRGTMIDVMAKRYLQRDPFGTLYTLGIPEPSAGVAAAGLTIRLWTSSASNGAATAGTLSLYIAGTRVNVGVAYKQTPQQVATNMAAIINANPDLPVNAAVVASTTPPPVVGMFIPYDVKLTCRWKGYTGNDIDVRFNYLGANGGEFAVFGLSARIEASWATPGSVNPSLTAGLASLGSTPYDFIIMPFNDTASLDSMKNFLADDVGRWSWQQMVYGGCFTAYRGSLGTCTAFGLTRNDQHTSIMSVPFTAPDPLWTWCAEIGAACAASLRVDPALPLQYISTTLKAPLIPYRWTLGERNTLLYDGLSTFRVAQDNTVFIERMTTTYQKNAAGVPDDSYLDLETMYELMFVARDLSTYLQSRYSRKKLVSDVTPVVFGNNTVNTAMIKASVILEYRALETLGYVQNSPTFAQNLRVENAGHGLVKILAPVDLANQLRQVVVLLQFQKS